MPPTVDTTDEKEPPKAKAPAADLNTIMKQAADLKTAQMKDKRRIWEAGATTPPLPPWHSQGIAVSLPRQHHVIGTLSPHHDCADGSRVTPTPSIRAFKAVHTMISQLNCAVFVTEPTNVSRKQCSRQDESGRV